VGGAGSVDGTGGTGANAGGNGRLVIGNNAPTGFGGTVTGASTTTGAGSTDANPFLGGTPQTPFIPNLPTVGAEIYGLTSLTAAGLYGSLPATDVNGTLLSSAVGALFRTDASVLGPAFSGYDALLYINLSGSSISNPEMAIDAALQQLIQRGWANNTNFGGGGAVSLGSLAGGAVYGTLVPTGSTANAAIQLTLPGGTFSANASALATDGQALYAVPEPSTVALSLMGGFGLLLAALRRRREV
jgi:hypothetical protein